ncbi:carboxymuconolactone decarboxylase family protein [Paenibacillus motobuensis]|uniref:carboxymuconolactone decarboxylase family protein n=1 Tax=Paenibacillus TaxID=44249 RepID=UPI00203A635D|nr:MULTISPECIES: carboxymuconolactone decarboxylase family protein [Paenibacillus]MCM3041456.1 carboxymuconolactone decarboxylase family protein [Paenibacillus lutimineralis]MCM3648560.1 carboxymuconolactone decarboxylase family protein [Paenibacillus motobuensis]
MNYYESSNLKRLPELIRLAPSASKLFLSFENEIYQEMNTLSLKTKELIALAVAHVTGCPYCIDEHAKRLKALGGTREEAFEAVLVATSTRAGAILSHATHLLPSFDEAQPENQESPINPEHPNPPSCFC